MTTKTITDQAGDTVRISTGTLTAPTGHVTVKVNEHYLGREYSAAAHADPAALRAALDEVAPLGKYTRTTPDPDDMDGGVAAALIEREAEDTLSLVQQQRDQAIGRVNTLSDENDDLRARAEEAERERDEARATKDMHKRRADEERARADQAEKERDAARHVLEEHRCGEQAERAYRRAVAAESRPLSPDAITDEMVERAHDYWGHNSIISRDGMRGLLTAALTEPPARPEWLDAPAVRAWHKRDRRTEHDGTPGKPRIWSPDYGTTETWSTPSLREVPWTDLVDVEPLDVSAELAEGLDRVAEFMRTGGVRVVGEEQS